MTDNYEDMSEPTIDNYEVDIVVEVDPPQTFRFYGDDESEEDRKEMIKYAQMAKAFMNKPFRSPLDIVGNIEWHEELPYENYLFGPLGTLKRSMKVVDFGCGPGRMINRALKLFETVDGVDISEYALDYAGNEYPNSMFYPSSGLDMGAIPSKFYDIIFSTISMQHIPSRKIRNNILKSMWNALYDNGWITLQLAYHPTYQAGVWSSNTEHATYEADFLGAQATNGHADVVINEDDLPKLQEDIEKIGFKNFGITHLNVEELYGNLNGRYHAPYWARDWIFVRGQK